MDYDGSSYSMEVTRQVRPTMAPRHLLITRSSTYGSGSGGRSEQRTSRQSYGAPSGALALMTSSGGVGNVKSSRDKEKKEMQDLNERFASYIEKVRFLEAQNRRLSDELEKLKSKWGKETTQIKAMYEAELEEAKRLLEEAENEKARLEKRVAALEDQLEDLKNKLEEAMKAAADHREKIDQQNQQMSDYEAEIFLLRRRVEGMTGDRDKDKKRIAQLQDALNRARMDLDNETLLHLDAENKRQLLEEELEFLQQAHDQEMKELAALAYRDTTSENREFWKNEMGQALRDIQGFYDGKLDDIQDEMETYYNLKVQEFRTGATRGQMDVIHTKEETTRLKNQLQDLRNKLNDLEARNQALQRELENLRLEYEERERALESENSELKGNVAKMRAEMEAILKELQELLDTKLGLELEIAAYRKLLEGEDDRIGLKQVVDSMYGAFSSIGEGPADTSSVRQVVRGEMTAKTTHQRSAKGPTAIGDCSSDGKSVMLENTGRKEEKLGNWKIVRVLDGQDGPVYTLPADFELSPGAKVKFWASGCVPADAKKETDKETNVSNFGTGSNITTKLVNPSGEDRATHVQRTVMS